MSEPSPIPDPHPPAVTATGLQPAVAAGLAWLFSLVGGIVLLVIEPRDKFVRFWAMQSVLWGLVILLWKGAVSVAAPVLGWLPLIGGILAFFLMLAFWLVSVGWVAVFLFGLVKAFSGVEWEIPWIGRLARQWLSRGALQEPPTV